MNGMGAANGMDGWENGCALFSYAHLDVTIEMVKPAADGLTFNPYQILDMENLWHAIAKNGWSDSHSPCERAHSARSS